jgi:hypothetical protein
MINRKTTNHTIAWFADQKRANNLDMEPPYQRNDMVWSEAYRRYFIDTILRNFPSPAIFLHVEISANGETTYHVVDGKQRLTAIFDYIEGKFTVKGNDVPEVYSGIEFSDLSDELKKEFWQYSIPIQEVYNTSDAELREAFDRLNRNVARLSNQELRHARFDGEFINMIEGLVEDPFWEDVGIATRANLKRMKIDEFVSEIFLLTMHGVLDGTQSKVLDKYYKDYDDEIPDKDISLRRYKTVMRIIEDLGEDFIRTSRYKNFSDFYSLWASLLPFSDRPNSIDVNGTRVKLTQFETDYSNYVNNPTPEVAGDNYDVITYYDNARQGVNKEANRRARADVLGKLIQV